MKRIIAITVLLTVFFIVFPVQAQQREGESGVYGNITYELTNYGIEITGYASEPVGDVEIPELIDGSTVTRIRDEAFKDCKTITSIKAVKVMQIGGQAFSGCTALKYAEFPYAAHVYGEAFAYCTALKEADMSSTGSFEYSVFKGCTALETINLGRKSSVGMGAFEGCTSLINFIISEKNKDLSTENGILYNADKTYIEAYPSAKGDVVLADSVLALDFYAFAGCTGLTSIEMPNAEGLLDYAFKDCISLTSVDMHSVSLVHSHVFEGCSSLKCIDLPALQFINHYALAGCEKLEEVYFYSDAPYVEGLLDGCAENITVYYAKGTTGWSDWVAYPTQEFTPVKVTFKDGISSEEIGTRITHPGGSVYAPTAPVHDGLEFTGWDKDFSSVTEDITVTALYSAPEFSLGDLNSDSKINTADAVVVLKAAASMITLNETQQKAGDCNGDGKVNTADAVLILKYAAGMITSF